MIVLRSGVEGGGGGGGGGGVEGGYAHKILLIGLRNDILL